MCVRHCVFDLGILAKRKNIVNGGNDMTLDGFSEILKVILQIANVAVLGYALYKFLNKPHNTLEAKVNEHEIEIKDIKQSLLQGNDRFREQENSNKEQERTNEVMQTCMLALIDFELAYCIHSNYTDTEDLIKAKDVLRRHLARK